jgi:hypothetical protein
MGDYRLENVVFVSRVRRLVLAGAVGVLLVASPMAAEAASASGYSSQAACEAAGQAGVREGYWSFYDCRFYDGGWHLLPE